VAASREECGIGARGEHIDSVTSLQCRHAEAGLDANPRQACANGFEALPRVRLVDVARSAMSFAAKGSEVVSPEVGMPTL
jgi:hypothetical protein